MENNKSKLLYLVIVVSITALVLSPVNSNKFVWDDVEYIINNKSLAKPFSEAVKFFFDQNYFVGNYHPVTMIVYSMEYKFAKLNPEFYHKVNWFIHLLNVALVFWFVFLLSNRKILVAALVSLLFGIHPMHVESVAWISELKDLMFAFFYLLGLIVYLLFQKRTGVVRSLLYVFCLVFFVFSLLSKPAAVSFPLALMAIDYYNHRKLDFKLIFEKIPFLIGSVILGLITIKAQGSAVGKIETYNLLERIMLSSYAFVNYLVKLVVPINLSAFHPFPARIDGQFPVLFWLAPIIVVLILFLIYKNLQSNRLLVFGFMFFIVNIFLVLQFVPVGMSLTSERYTYVPYIGLFFILSMYLYDYLNRKTSTPSTRFFSYGAVFVICFVFAGISFSRTKVWKSNKTLWTDVVRKYPQCATAHYNLGSYYFKEEKNDVQALVSYNKALKADTTYIKAFVNRGIIYTRMKEYQKAESDFLKAIAIDPDFAETYKNYGVLYNFMGNFDKAVESYSRYLKLEPKSHDIYYGKGMTLYQLKRFEEAAVDFSKAIELDPLNSNYWIMKSMSLDATGKNEEAIKAALKAQELGEVLDPAYKASLNIK